MGKRMNESRARIQARLSQLPPRVVDTPTPPADLTPAAPAPKQNCATCALYPCLLWRNRPDAQILRGPKAGLNYDWKSLSVIPMLCGGSYWEPRKQSAWEQDRKRGPSGLEQFRRKDGQGQ